MTDTDLAERLHHLAAHAPVPVVTTADDVRRGRRRLRRRRLAEAGGAALAVAAVTGLALGAAGPQRATVPDPAPAGRPAAGQVEDLVRARGEVDVTKAQLLALTEQLEGTFDVRRTRLLALGGSTSWADARADQCPAGWTCQDVDVEGASRAKIASDGTSAQAIAEFPEGVVVVTFSSAAAVPGGLPYHDPDADAAQVRVRD